MALIGISVTKSCTFRDSVQEFSNIYHYQYLGLNPGEAMALEFLDALVAKEKVVHSSIVTFVRGKVWSAGGTKAENQMIAQKVLSGTGSAASDSGLDRERAYLIYWDAGFDSRNKPVKLRKWFHTCGWFGSTGPDSANIGNVTAFTTAKRNAIAAAGDAFTNISPASSPATIARLVGPTGRETDGAAKAHKYLEHHQLGDAWR